MFALNEAGELRMTANGTVIANPWSWTRTGWVLVLDAPVGTGFSWTPDGDHGYSLFHSKALIGKESAPKAFCGVIGRHLRPCLLCLIIFNRNNAKNHLLAYISLPPLHGHSWVQFITQ